MKIGVLSDTHGHIPPSVLEAFREAEVEQILHAGDFHDERQLALLESIAPVSAVRGNNDFRSNLPKVAHFDWEGVSIHLAHKPQDLMRSIQSAFSEEPILGIHGHLHVPKFDSQGRMIIASPGSPTYPRGGSKPTVLILELDEGAVRPEFIEIKV